MNLILITPPVLEPITLAELKLHLRADSGTFDSNLALTQSLAYGSKGVSAGGLYTLLGTGIDVLGKQADVIVHHGTNGATGTVDTKIQEADALAGPYTDWTGGAFAQVTTANDNADFKLPYTGTKQFVRTASKVLLAACEFGTSILVNAAVTAEDASLADLITLGREEVEKITWRKLLTSTWDYYLPGWPQGNYINLPGGNLQSVTSVKWKDTAGTETTLTPTTDYLVETNGDQCGGVILPYGGTWPSGSLYPSNPITIRFVAGWTTAALIPKSLKSAVLFAAQDAYYHGDRHETLKPIIENLCTSRLWSFV